MLATLADATQAFGLAVGSDLHSAACQLGCSLLSWTRSAAEQSPEGVLGAAMCKLSRIVQQVQLAVKLTAARKAALQQAALFLRATAATCFSLVSWTVGALTDPWVCPAFLLNVAWQ